PAPKVQTAPPRNEQGPPPGGERRRTLADKAQNPGTAFTDFVEPLIAQAYMSLGMLRNPYQPKPTIDVGAARQMIEIMTMLNEKTNELIDLAKAYGIKTFPLYAASAAALARQASTKGNRIAVDWGYKAADTLDPGSPSVAFTRADAARDQQKWANALPAAASGF